MTTYQFGRQPNDPTKLRLRLNSSQFGAITPPPAADWVSGVKAWPMSLNDSLGDCVAAGAGHFAQAIDYYGRQQNSPVADTDVLKMYETISGYIPGQPATDVGATLQDGLDYWRKTGIGGNNIAAFAQIDHTNVPLVQNCINLFGGVYTGMNFPASAMDQFNSGGTWSVVARSAIEGGHCVPIHAYDTGSFTCVTWGATQRMDIKFFQRYFDEVWVPIDLDWLSSSGFSPGSVDTNTLNADFMALTGSPGPFPQTDPSPVPAPAAGDPNDLALAATCREWSNARHTGQNRVVARALTHWLAAKGL